MSEDRSIKTRCPYCKRKWRVRNVGPGRDQHVYLSGLIATLSEEGVARLIDVAKCLIAMNPEMRRTAAMLEEINAISRELITPALDKIFMSSPVFTRRIEKP